MDSSLKFSIHVAHAAANANEILGLIRSFVYLDIALMKLHGSLLYTLISFQDTTHCLQCIF